MDVFEAGVTSLQEGESKGRVSLDSLGMKMRGPTKLFQFQRIVRMPSVARRGRDRGTMSWVQMRNSPPPPSVSIVRQDTHGRFA